jgi:hypothetical protein
MQILNVNQFERWNLPVPSHPLPWSANADRPLRSRW